MKRPLILVTNDDGISAPGIRNLIRIMKDFGDVVVVAPDKPQSAMGHASLAVTLGYLRGLEIPSLKLSDMPRL